MELLVGATAHYEDPSFYTHTYRERLTDVEFYVDLANEVGGPVIEYGAGNGRIALPIARHGHRIMGVDWSRPMLADLKARLAGEPKDVRDRVSVTYGDMRKVKLRSRANLVLCTFNTALHLYTRQDVEKFFDRVKAHMAPGATFAMDLSVPVAVDLARNPNKSCGAPPFRHPTEGIVLYREYFDYEPAKQILYITAVMKPKRLRPGNRRGGEEFTVPLAHRQFFPLEWEALLHYNGFKVTELYGEFDKSPLQRESDTMIWIAKKR